MSPSRERPDVGSKPAPPVSGGWRHPTRTRKGAAIASAVLIVVVLSPLAEVFKDDPTDRFPLSYYPMFSRKRADDLAVMHFVGLNAAGERRFVPFTYFSLGGLNAVRKQIRRLVRAGAAPDLCATVAGRLAEQPTSALADVREVQVVTAYYDYERYFRGDTTPTREKVHASCVVPR